MHDIYLVVLMALVGITIGFNEGIVDKLKRHTLHIIVVPTCIIVATILGGVVCSFISGYPMNISTAIAAGLGWYSLSGVTMTDLVGAQIGTITFMSSLMREIFSFMTIPFISRYLNYSSAIAPAAATSEDTTLGMMIKYTDAEHVVVIPHPAVPGGVLISSPIEHCTVDKIVIGHFEVEAFDRYQADTSWMEGRNRTDLPSLFIGHGPAHSSF